MNMVFNIPTVSAHHPNSPSRADTYEKGHFPARVQSAQQTKGGLKLCPGTASIIVTTWHAYPPLWEKSRSPLPLPLPLLLLSPKCTALLYHQNYLLTRVFCSNMAYLLSLLMCATITSRQAEFHGPLCNYVKFMSIRFWL